MIIDQGVIGGFTRIFINAHLAWNEYFIHDYLLIAGFPDFYVRGMLCTWMFEKKVLDYTYNNQLTVAFAKNVNMLAQRAKEGQSVAIVSPTDTFAPLYDNPAGGNPLKSMVNQMFLAGVVETSLLCSEHAQDVWILVQMYGQHDHLNVQHNVGTIPGAAMIYEGFTPGTMVLAPISTPDHNSGGTRRSLGGRASIVNSLDPIRVDLDGRQAYATGLQGSATVRFYGLLAASAMNAAQVVPPGASTELQTGSIVNAWIDTITDKLYIEITHSVAGATAINLRGPALPGAETGTLKAVLTLSATSNNVFSYSGGDEQDIIDGKWYVEIESGTFPSGAIRGQIAQWRFRNDGTNKVTGLVPMTTRTTWAENDTPGFPGEPTAALPPSVGIGMQGIGSLTVPTLAGGNFGEVVQPGLTNAYHRVVGVKFEGATRKADRGFQPPSGTSVCAGFVDFLGKTIPET